MKYVYLVYRHIGESGMSIVGAYSTWHKAEIAQKNDSKLIIRKIELL